ncbi:MAG: hypothetical protein Q9162_003972 [Coniocarpon cinnabarinum]
MFVDPTSQTSEGLSHSPPPLQSANIGHHRPERLTSRCIASAVPSPLFRPESVWSDTMRLLHRLAPSAVMYAMGTFIRYDPGIMFLILQSLRAHTCSAGCFLEVTEGLRVAQAAILLMDPVPFLNGAALLRCLLHEDDMEAAILMKGTARDKTEEASLILSNTPRANSCSTSIAKPFSTGPYSLGPFWPPHAAQTMASPSEDCSTLSILSRLRDSEVIPPDYTIHCKGEAFQAHKFILKLRSDYFRAMLSPTTGFIESGQDEINLDHASPRALSAVLDILYSDDYECKPDFEYHIQISDLASYLQIKQVDNVIARKICSGDPIHDFKGWPDHASNDAPHYLQKIFANARIGHSELAVEKITEFFVEYLHHMNPRSHAEDIFESTPALAVSIVQTQQRENLLRLMCPACRELKSCNPSDDVDCIFMQCENCGSTQPTLDWLKAWLGWPKTLASARRARVGALHNISYL